MCIELAFKNLRCNMLWCHFGRYFYSLRFRLGWFGWLHLVIDYLKVRKKTNKIISKTNNACPQHLDRFLVSIVPGSYSLLLPLDSHLKQNNLKIIS